MKREPWILKNAFWLLMGVCMTTSAIAMFRHKELAACLFGTVGAASALLGINFWVQDVTKRRDLQQPLNPYDQAVYYRARKRTFKVITGGKSESVRNRKT